RPLSASSLCFLFQCSGVHRDLHSFLHDALPIWHRAGPVAGAARGRKKATRSAASAGAAGAGRGHFCGPGRARAARQARRRERHIDRKSTRLNSSHLVISYAVFCLKKKKRRTTIVNTSTPIMNSINPIIRHIIRTVTTLSLLLLLNSLSH